MVDKAHITSLLPHRDPIVMIDDLIESDAASATTNFKIQSDNFFICDQKFSDAGIIENIAQTAMVGGHYQLKEKGEIMQPAFIGEIKNLKIHQRANIGQIITTKTEIINRVFNIALIRAEVFCAHELIATCEMKLVTHA